ncbi:pyrroloquinoline quinone biosynthesis protein PqqF, partial [Pantoea allii]
TTQTGMTRQPHASADNALLLFIPLHRPEQLAALRVLALIYEPRFFQRYRVEQPIGYVVSSRYMRCADEDGVLFALQSPDYSALSLLRYCRNFLRSLNETLTGCDLVALKARLLSQEVAQPLAQLRRENGLAEVDAAQVGALTLTDLQQLHRTLIQDRRRWRVLFTGGGNL